MSGEQAPGLHRTLPPRAHDQTPEQLKLHSGTVQRHLATRGPPESRPLVVLDTRCASGRRERLTTQRARTQRSLRRVALFTLALGGLCNVSVSQSLGRARVRRAGVRRSMRRSASRWVSSKEFRKPAANPRCASDINVALNFRLKSGAKARPTAVALLAALLGGLSLRFQFTPLSLVFIKGGVFSEYSFKAPI